MEKNSRFFFLVLPASILWIFFYKAFLKRPFLRVYGKKWRVKIILHNFKHGRILHVYNAWFRISQWVKGINIVDLKIYFFLGIFFCNCWFYPLAWFSLKILMLVTFEKQQRTSWIIALMYCKKFCVPSSSLKPTCISVFVITEGLKTSTFLHRNVYDIILNAICV